MLLAKQSHWFCTPFTPVKLGSTRARPGRQRSQILNAVGWDPEGILGAPIGGHIQRRSLTKEMQANKEFAKQVEEQAQRMREELERKREARIVPGVGEHAKLAEFFLDTEGSEMEYEVARCRPLITQDFFTNLDTCIGQERFAATVNEDRLAELETLRDYLKVTVAEVDQKTANVVAPVDRLKALLTAPDKKAKLLEMAGNNEIDQPFMELLQSNISGARASGQEQAAEFMEKIFNAARKFVIKMPSSPKA